MMWRLALAVLALGFASLGAAAQGDLLALDRADVVPGAPGDNTLPPQISLPLHWDLAQPARSGRADLSLRFDLPATATSGEPYGIYIARLGNAYEIELNGALLGAGGVLDVPRDHWAAKQPVSLNVPASLLREHNDLRVRLRADGSRRAGLSTVLLGPARLVTPLAAQGERVRVVLPQAAAVFSLLIAAFCALLWWQQRDALYAWAALGEALWAVVLADAVIESAPLMWPNWGLVIVALRASWAWSLYCFAGQVFGPRPRSEVLLMATVQLSVTLLAVAAATWRVPLALVVAQAANLLMWLVVIPRLALQARRQASSDRVLLVLAIAACVLAGMRDGLAARWSPALYDESSWIKYVAPLLGLAVMWVVSLRFRQARQEVVRLNESLVGRVQEKERELRHSFERLAEVERTSAVLAERQRILRDMHDGVGANLATAVRQLEGGQAHADDVAKTLRESMDHLKLSIDAMSLPPGDVNALLASLRYRLQPRIEAAGLELEWAVEALPPWPDGNDAAMRHLQFLLLEAISNALQHAQATRLVLSARTSDAGIEVSLCDDGRGLPPGRSLRSLKERAGAMGARLVVEPASPGTCVRVLLGRPAEPAPDAGQFGNDLAR